MPVISPRRSSTSASGSIYGTSSSSAAVGPTTSTDSSSSSRSVSDRYSSSGYKSYLDRAGSLSKLTGSSSSYSPSLSSYSSYSTYTPRSSTTYRSSASSLTGGSSGVGTYRSILPSLGSGSSSYDTTTLSRYGVSNYQIYICIYLYIIKHVKYVKPYALRICPLPKSSIHRYYTPARHHHSLFFPLDTCPSSQ